ncbi:MAG: molybdopterin molybdotransferase MoeA [Epsilonproteobacteria bacterium]|nr:molybdopterin molybdotransferase MoeA [Campylobacterota bacterium]
MSELQIGFYDALSKALQKAQPKTQIHTVTLTDALFRVLAEDIIVKKNLPSFDNSAMDGFAYRYDEADNTLHVKQTIFAGDVPKANLLPGECYRIMTGAQLPSDVDTVAPIEKCENVTQESVYISKAIKKGSNFRKKGEEIKIGEVLLHKGEILSPADIALLSAQGIMAIKVYEKPRIAIVATGNEIKEPWEEANEDEIYNANAFGIQALLKNFHFDASYIGSIPDDLERTKEFIGSLKTFDVIITTGGISQGDADFLYEAFIYNGLENIFHGVRVKPGHPVMMGTMDDTFVMAMPGNPLTTMLTVHAFSLPVLYKISGASKIFHPFSYARFSQDLKLKSGRVNMVIGELENGIVSPINNNKIGSGMLTPLSKSNVVIYFDEHISEVQKDDLVKVIFLDATTRVLEFQNFTSEL